jgi:hypothetical protein
VPFLDTDWLIVIECKATVAKHASPDTTNFSQYAAEYAVDGVLFYAAGLSTKYHVIAIAVSGQDTKELTVSTYLHHKG